MFCVFNVLPVIRIVVFDLSSWTGDRGCVCWVVFFGSIPSRLRFGVCSLLLRVTFLRDVPSRRRMLAFKPSPRIG